MVIASNKKRDDADNKLLLVYPFDIEDALLSDAASGQKELDGDLLGLHRADVRRVSWAKVKLLMEPKSQQGHIMKLYEILTRKGYVQFNFSTIRLLTFGCAGKLIFHHYIYVICCHQRQLNLAFFIQ